MQSIVRLISYTKNPEKIVAIAARLCYSRHNIDEVIANIKPSDISRSINILTERHHESPIEHASFTFGISNISRACMSQITRHRIASFSVKSQRYINERDFKYITPPKMKDDVEYENIMKYLSEMYRDMKSKRYKNEDSRFILPNACTTQLIMTANARSLRNFFTLRCAKEAQWEIRDVANKMLSTVKIVAPLLFNDLRFSE
jgi:thymidylate synthase (FAD)